MTAEPRGLQDTDHPDIIDLEAYAKAGREVPPGRQYQIRIDKDRHTVRMPKITGREILALVNKTPETHFLHQRLRGGATGTIEADDVVDLTGPGPERFMTMKRETQEGLAEPRRQFQLTTADQAFLNEHFSRWETVMEGSAQWVVIRDFALPPGFSLAKADVAIQLVAGYPDAALDMAYFSPAVVRSDGKEIPALSPQPFDGGSWQRWSRHRTTANPWMPGVDNLATHVAYVNFFLAEEFKKRP